MAEAGKQITELIFCSQNSKAVNFYEQYDRQQWKGKVQTF
jgi:hypothetical protein